MTLSRAARIVSGATLLSVPTILYGGWTLLGILTRGTAGSAPAGLSLSLVVQVLLDAARLSKARSGPRASLPRRQPWPWPVVSSGSPSRRASAGCSTSERWA